MTDEHDCEPETPTATSPAPRLIGEVELRDEHLAGLGVPRAWFRAEVIAGRIPCLAMGSRRLYSWPAVEAALMALASGAGAGDV